MFSIKNKENIPHQLTVTSSTGSTLFFDFTPNQTLGPFSEMYREYFQKNAVAWAVILPDYSKQKSEPVTIQSIAKPIIEPRTVKAEKKKKPRQYKKRSN